VLNEKVIGISDQKCLLSKGAKNGWRNFRLKSGRKSLWIVKTNCVQRSGHPIEQCQTSAGQIFHWQELLTISLPINHQNGCIYSVYPALNQVTRHCPWPSFSLVADVKTAEYFMAIVHVRVAMVTASAVLTLKQQSWWSYASKWQASGDYFATRCRHDVRVVLRSFYESLAIGILSECYSSDQRRATLLAVRQMTNYGRTTLLELAVRANNNEFVAHTVCQNVLTVIWFGQLEDDNSKRRVRRTCCSIEALRERTEYVPQLWNWENHS